MAKARSSRMADPGETQKDARDLADKLEGLHTLVRDLEADPAADVDAFDRALQSLAYACLEQMPTILKALATLAQEADGESA